jgi:hypothetical protein
LQCCRMPGGVQGLRADCVSHRPRAELTRTPIDGLHVAVAVKVDDHADDHDQRGTAR